MRVTYTTEVNVTSIKIDGVAVKRVPEHLRAELLKQARKKLTKSEVAAIERYLGREK